MTTEPYVPSEMELVQSHAFFAPARPQDMDVRAKAAERGIAKIKADALRAFADELESQERVSPDDAMTILAMRERADEIEQEARERLTNPPRLRDGGIL
ncbi:hypothetical protein [Brevibacterium casei]|uniref:Uncharacterized protein n=1 Tax=Brevibacterium casei TaxID=33889 RepID=A0A7T2TGP3_9MICO|nr:hypothetical protein [Brevibacterium casei]QPS33439.1 hypothetical protein I6G59_16140 [Brevibacterium casei]